MSLSWKKKLLLAKIETVYGTDSGPTASANAILALDVSISPMEGQDVSRNLEVPYLGGQETMPVNLHSTITFKTELAGSGAAGTAPAWGALMRGCGCAEVVDAGTSVTYNPVSDGHESLSIHFTIASTRYVLKGARGTVKLTMTQGGIPMLEWSFKGLFAVPTEVVMASPDYAAWTKPKPSTMANTPTHAIDGTAVVMKSFALDFGNEVSGRFMIGSEEIRITDRSEVVDVQIDALPVTTLNPYQLALDGTLVPLQIVHGTAAGQIITVDVPQMQLMRPSAPGEDQKVVSWTLKGTPIPDSGNDQFTLTLT